MTLVYTKLVCGVLSCPPSTWSSIPCVLWPSELAYRRLRGKHVEDVRMYTPVDLHGILRSTTRTSDVRDNLARNACVLGRRRLLLLVSSLQLRCPKWFRVGCADNTMLHFLLSSIALVVHALRPFCES